MLISHGMSAEKVASLIQDAQKDLYFPIVSLTYSYK